MQPFTLYVIAAILFILGLAAIGGATFGRKRNQRILLAIVGAVLWIATLLLYSNAVSQTETVIPPTSTVAAPTPTPQSDDTPAPEPDRPAETAEPLPEIPGRIAFHSDRTGDLEIWTMDANGAGQTMLTQAPGRDIEPSWSPDGSEIVFTSSRDDPENPQLYLMAADGSDQRPLMSFAPEDQLGGRWSPDGQWILFHSNRLIDAMPWIELYKVRRDGTELTRLTDPPGNNFRGDWSPDGRSIIFVSDRDGNRDLYVMDADGGNQMRLTNSPSDENRPRWSSTGSQILLESNRDGTSNLYVMDAPSRGVAEPPEDSLHLLTFPGFSDESPAWAVGEAQVIFSSDRATETVINWELFAMNADGSRAVRLTTSEGADRFPDWTP